MPVTTQMIKELREKTGAGVLDCRNTLNETDGDMEKAVELLRQKGLDAAAKKAARAVAEGRIDAYVHAGDKLATLIQVNCETDFVARTEEFKKLCHDLAMQVAASNPRWVSREQIPAEDLERQKQECAEEVEPGKPPQIVERIIEGKLAKFFRENCLLEQPFIRDDKVSIQDLLNELVAVLGENVQVGRFVRMVLGEGPEE